MNNQSGFTLFEIIVVLMLMGLIAVLSLFFIISGVSGYVFSKQNTALSQKASLALARIVKELNSELREISVIPISSPFSSIKYVYQYDPKYYRYLALVGTGARKEIKLVVGDKAAPGSLDPEVLIDQVSDFALTFQKCDNSPWLVTHDLDDLCKIAVTMTLFINPTDDKTVTFTTTVNPPGQKKVIG